MHPVARWFLFLVNFLLVLLAIVQVTGRLLMPWLSNFEDELNLLLAGQHISVSGLEGGWSLLNPVVRAASVRLPAGELKGLVLQPDLLESAFRSSLVMRRARVEGGHLAFAKTDDGWWLAGMERGARSPVDLESLLLESDELAGGLRITFLGEIPKSVDARLAAINRGGRHALALQVSNHECPDCTLELRVDRTDSVPFLRPIIHDGYVDVQHFVIPAPLVRGAGIVIGSIDGSWRHRDEQGRGKISIHDLRVDVDGLNSFTGSADFRVWSKEAVGGIGGDVSFKAGNDEVIIAGVNIHYADQELQLQVDLADLTALNSFAGKVAAPTDRVGRWFQGLAVQGEASDVWAFVRRNDEETSPEWRFGYGARLSHVHVKAFGGVPELHDAGVEIIGHRRGFAATVYKPDLRVEFPDMFSDGWDATDTSGIVQVWFRPGYTAVLGQEMSVSTLGLHARGSFAISNPEALSRKLTTLLVSAERADLLAARTFVPRTLEPGLLKWIDQAPTAGTLENIRFVYQGQMKAPGVDHARRVEIRTELGQGALRFHEEWPALEDLSGHFVLRGNDVSFLASNGRSLGIDMTGSKVEVIDRARDVLIDLEADGDGRNILGYARNSPLMERLRFIKPAWALDGSVRMKGRVKVPLKRAADEDRKAEIRLEGQLDSVRLELPDLRLSFADLKGNFKYVSPFGVTAEGMTGSLWGEDVILDVQHGADHVRFKAEGRLGYERALSIAGLSDPGFVSGRLGYHADVGVAVNPGATTEISVTSDLEGISLDLPEGLAKDADDLTPSTMGLQLLPDYSALSFQYQDVQGWMHVKGSPLRGAIGIAAPPPMIDVDENIVRIGGRLHSFRLTEWTRLFKGGGVAGSSRSSPEFEGWQVNDLRVDRGLIGDTPFDDLILDGQPEKGRISFTILGEDIAGQVSFGGLSPVEIELGLLRFPATETPVPVDPPRRNYGPHPDQDPLSESLIPDLPEANVRIERIFRGEEDFGKWQFKLRKPSRDVAHIETLEAEVKGLEIKTSTGITWTAAYDLTSFNGVVTMQDLALVLPQWRYAPSVTTESAELTADVHWSGSPLNISIPGMVGAIDFSAKNGRFLEVESGSGAMRFMSLFSFTAIVKRLSLNFSDVIGKGVGFETLEAGIDLSDSVLTFVKPMEVKSTSSDFRLGGTVNMVTGALDNELVVTLPVSKNLPWYGVYIALANPLAGLGVLVGERMLRKPLEQFSSAKYVVRGTLDEPDVRFVELFDSKVTKRESPDRKTSPGPEAAPIDGMRTVDGAKPKAKEEADRQDDTLE